MVISVACSSTSPRGLAEVSDNIFTLPHPQVHNEGGAMRVVVTKDLPGDRWINILTQVRVLWMLWEGRRRPPLGLCCARAPAAHTSALRATGWVPRGGVQAPGRHPQQRHHPKADRQQVRRRDRAAHRGERGWRGGREEAAVAASMRCGEAAYSGSRCQAGLCSGWQGNLRVAWATRERLRRSKDLPSPNSLLWHSQHALGLLASAACTCRTASSGVLAAQQMGGTAGPGGKGHRGCPQPDPCPLPLAPPAAPLPRRTGVRSCSGPSRTPAARPTATTQWASTMWLCQRPRPGASLWATHQARAGLVGSGEQLCGRSCFVGLGGRAGRRQPSCGISPHPPSSRRAGRGHGSRTSHCWPLHGAPHGQPPMALHGAQHAGVLTETTAELAATLTLAARTQPLPFP